MKLKYITGLLFCAALSFTSCDDFFQVTTNTELESKDYINLESELYSGYIGIVTKLQAVGDKNIYLNDVRAEMIEPTQNAPTDLIDIYNYKEDLTGNSYANPAPYYDVIMACNDYLKRAKEYKTQNLYAIDMDHYKALVSSALRIKAWTYLTMAKIYNKVIWLDDPLEKDTDITRFPVKDLKETVKACRAMLDEGFDGAPGNLSFSWREWVDPDTEVGESIYRYWDYMTPAYFALYAELCLWDGDYQQTVTLIQREMAATFATTVNDATHYMHNTKVGGTYGRIWDTKDPSAQEAVSCIMYSYTENQTNHLLQHFGTDSPNKYLLRPSTVGMARFEDDTFNPGHDTDKRLGVTYREDKQGNWVINKFRPVGSSVRPNAYEEDVPIYMYRGADLYFMMAEALNQLGRYEAASALINQGINSKFPNGGIAEADQSEWGGFTDDWTSVSAIGTRKYPDMGIRGALSNSKDRPFKFKGAEGMTDDEIKRFNDEAILDEMMIEFTAEGRTLPAMIRVAQRWNNDYTIVSSRVAPKYANPDEIKSKIDKGQVFINYSLK